MTAKLKIEEVNRRITEIHQGKVILDESSYIDTATKCRFVDKDYGEWYQKPNHVLKGHKHPKRAYLESFTPLQEIKNKIYEIHGDVVTLDESTYFNMSNKCTFYDKEYGSWKTSAYNVICGHGHRLRAVNNLIISAEIIKERLYQKYSDNITLDENSYVNITTDCIFYDKEYGSFSARPAHVLDGNANHPTRLKKKRSLNAIKLIFDRQNKKGSKLSWSSAKFAYREDLNKKFRSGWEANFARILNYHNKKWEYEPCYFELSNGSCYIPDFYYDNLYVEIKGRWFKGQKDKIELLRKEFPNIKLEIVEEKEYNLLKKYYKPLIPNWEGK